MSGMAGCRAEVRVSAAECDGSARRRIRRAARRAAAAPGSSASVIARTTTTRRAPASSTSSRLCLVDAADREPRPRRGEPGRVADQAEARRRACLAWSASARPVRRRSSRPTASVAASAASASEWVERPSTGSRPDDLALATAGGRSPWPTCSTSAPAGEGDVGPVVHREQRAVPVTGRAEHLEQAEFLAGLQPLLPELDDVHAGRRAPGRGSRADHPARCLRVGAQVQPRSREPGTERPGSGEHRRRTRAAAARIWPSGSGGSHAAILPAAAAPQPRRARRRTSRATPATSSAGTAGGAQARQATGTRRQSAWRHAAPAARVQRRSRFSRRAPGPAC